jgi:hypothetical protein
MKRIPALLSAFTVLLVAHATAFAAPKTTFRAILTGSEEVPSHDTKARGHATFILNKEGTEISYRLNVSNMDNVTVAHIHLGNPGENGAPVVTLYGPVAAGGGKKSGVLASGTIRASDLQGTLAGKTIADLVTEMSAGHAYVNVHTDDGTGEANRGPGDFPDGEIRGQIR